MEFSKKELVNIVERASTITERLGTGFLPNDALEFDDIVPSRLEKWCQIVAKGDQEKFEKRLAWDGLTLDTVRRVLGSVHMADEQNLPPWVKTLNEGIKASALISVETLEKGAAEVYRCLSCQEPVPFEEVFLPFIHIAKQKLIVRTGDKYHLLSEEAQATLERSLLGLLAGYSSPILELNFSTFRASKQSPLLRLLGQFESSHSKEQYQAFIKYMLKGGGLLSFFQQYPVLARLVATVTDFWVDAIGEFLLRLASDWSEIQRTFQTEAELSQVVTIYPSLSDPHNNGRSVIAVVFASGLKLIYKPRDLGLEEGYFKLLAWINQQGISLPFKLLRTINHSTYGWVEFVESLPCQDKQEVQRYYQRAGMLLCVLYLLKANDCHFENLISCGEHPVLVDMETLMHHQVRETADSGKYAQAQLLADRQLFKDSVLRSNFLPQWLFGPDGRKVFTLSGLGGADGEQETSYHVLKWRNINTDNMSLSYEFAKIPSRANVPPLKGVTLLPNDYVEELVDGFQQMYQFLVKHREALLVSDSPLTALNHQQVRFVFRATQVYGSILCNSLQPEWLRDGVERSIKLDLLSRAFLSSDSKPLLWSLLKVELQAMEQMDIPYFVAYSDSAALSIGSSQTIEQCFTEPTYSAVNSRLQQLSDKDLAQQIIIIRGSLYSSITSELSDTLPYSNAYLNFDAVAPLSQKQMVEQAVAIAQDLKRSAICAADGSATWIGLGYMPLADRFQLQPIGDGLYDGRCGVALFLAALEAVTGGIGFRDLALEALQPLRRVLQTSDLKYQQKFAEQTGIGGAMGLGSIIYALVRISQFLGEPALVEDAKQAAHLMKPEAIGTDQHFDVMGGSAGAILGLLALHNLTAEPAFLEQATICGNHLLKNRVASDTGSRTWLSLDGKLLTGFSHGAAGIAYALLRLYDTTQDSVFLKAAKEAIAYEHSVFSPEAGNWPDLRFEKPSFKTSWCHGAPGIGMVRLGGVSVLDTCQIRHEIEVALKTTLQVNLQGVDRLCCGNFGRIELLLIAAQQLSRPELIETAQKQAAWVVTRAEQAGSFYLFPNLHKDIYNPGFFLGTSGIGYELLRLAYPNLLPSVLLWQ
ncbi:Lanthionine synthetase C family protein [Scytonema hofmannii PCC 7110]|uniref:Lanthionine synthetase C family protein n=1 Tax=Scytonema hofmannii PCC 7110 TaxID=128403 RepID=A0A139X7I7_9CYAN|nr:type 2 lanthipeptide synthetase LanM family protein [Scytonema hofmannii]KYC40661.1 Lanthionine synthetase C family protein [Scytonema hofmannii PCC 7110]